MKQLRLLFTSAFLGFNLFTFAAPITGVFNIPGDYATLTSAINDLNINGVGNGGAIFNIAAGYSETVVGISLSTTSTIDANHFITFQKSGSGPDPVITGTGSASPTDAVITISGTSYVTFDAIDIAVSGTAVEYGYWVTNSSAVNGSQHNIIRNCHIIMNPVNTLSVGIMQSTLVSPSGTAGADCYNRYSKNYIDNSYCGITVNALAIWPDVGCSIDSNMVGTAYANSIGNIVGSANATWGIRVNYMSGIKITRNEVCNVTMPGTKNIGGIYIMDCVGTNEMSFNKVHDIKVTSTSLTSIPIGCRISIPQGATANMHNNMIWNITHGITTPNTNLLIEGMTVNHQASYRGTVNVYYNTVLISANAAATSTAFSLGYGRANVRDNIFVNLSPGGATSKRYCMYRYPSGNGVFRPSDYNDVYIASGTNNFIGYMGSDILTLANWRVADTGDAHSINVNPVFISPADLHLNPNANCAIDGAGIYISGFNRDIDNDSRDISPTPDMGADEFTGVPPAITATTPAYVCNSGSMTLLATASSGTVQWWDAPTGGTNIGSGNSYTTPVLTSTTTYYVETVNGSCTSAPRTSVTASVAPSLPVGITITSSTNNVCPNTLVDFTAVPVNGGTSPNYQWLVNGLNAGTNNPLFTYPPVNNDIVSCVLTSSALCATGNHDTSNKITMIVGDFLPPYIECPANITVNTDTNHCGALVTYITPEGTGCVRTNTVETIGLPSGATFPVGTTLNIFTATNDLGEVAWCSFTVTVIDNVPPLAVCGPNKIAYTAAGSCSAVVTFQVHASDNCVASITQTGGLLSGATYPVGTTVNTFLSTDASGNTGTCSLNVTVIDMVPPTMNCGNVQEHVTDPGVCGAWVNVISPVITDNCGVLDYINDRTGTDNASMFYPIGIDTVLWFAEDIHNNSSSCYQLIHVIDNEVPVLICSGDVSQNAAPGACSATVNLIPAVATDNCFYVNPASSNHPSNIYPVGTTQVTWTAFDINGNSGHCTQLVIVTDNEPPSIICAADLTQTAGPGVCSATVTLVGPTTGDNCGVASVNNDYTGNISAVFPVGITTITWTVTDVHGNINSCKQKIIVTDNEVPFIWCPAPQTMVAFPGLCYFSGSLNPPPANDNCGVATVLSNHPSNLFLVGTTTVTWTVTDIHNNINTCTQLITVTDNESPVIICPPDQTQTALPGTCHAAVTLSVPAVTDNCGVGSVVNDHPSNIYPVGNTTVIWTATDIHGNTGNCAQLITVTDDEVPSILCAADQTVNTNNSLCNAMVTVVGPATNDNCGVAAVNNDYTGTANASGIYPVGTTTVHWTVTDIYGLTNTCIQKITVIDNLPPVFMYCPPAQILCNSDANFVIDMALLIGMATDNCGIASLTNDQPMPFPVGVTTVTYTATDISGNTATCKQQWTLSPPITASIVQSNLPVFCQGESVILTVNTGATAASYLWSTGGTGQTIQVSSSGTYYVTITNNLGCQAYASYTLNLNPNGLLSSYVILTRHDVNLEGTTVMSGGVGVKGDDHGKMNGKIDAKKSTKIIASGTFAKAPDIHTDNTSNITTRFLAPAGVPWPPFETMNGHGTITVNVPDNSPGPVVLSGSLYKEIKVGKNSTVVFTQQVVDIENNFKLEDGATVKFATCTRIHMKDNLEAQKNITINPDDLSVTWYIDHDVNFNEGAHVTGIFFLGDANSHDSVVHHINIHESKKDRPGIFKGMFLAEHLEAKSNTFFYLDPLCNNCNPSSLATISQSETFCQGGTITLTASLTGIPAVSYLWSTGETTQSIQVSSGTYSVTITGPGGQESASVNISANASNMLPSYVILGGEEVNLEAYNSVLSGGVGVLGETGCENNPGTLTVNNHSNITAAGTYGIANTINVTNSSAVTTQYLSKPGIVLPYFKEMTYTSSNNITIANNATVTLSDTLYNQITLGMHSTVIFTQPVVNVCNNFTLGQSSTVRFTHCGKIRLKKGINASPSTTWNPDAYSIVAYSEADIQFKEGTTVKGIFFLGTTTECPGVIQTEHNFNMTGTSALPDNFFGMVLAEHVKGDYTNWNRADFCASCTKQPEAESDGGTSSVVIGKAIINNFPNPFSKKTEIQFILPENDQVKLDIYDITGKLIRTLYNGEVNRNQEYRTELDGTNLPAGIYIYKMTTGERVFTGKMILNKE